MLLLLMHSSGERGPYNSHFKKVKEQLLEELDELSKFNLFRKDNPEPDHIKNIKQQIQVVKKRIKEQDEELSAPFPTLSKTTELKLTDIKAEYVNMFKERVQIGGSHPKLDKQEEGEVKELLDGITYVLKTAHFLPLLKERQSALLMSDCRSEDLSYNIKLREYEEYMKEISSMEGKIEEIKEEIKKLEERAGSSSSIFKPHS